MITGLLEPDRGSITVFGIDALADPVEAKQITAWLSDDPMIYEQRWRARRGMTAAKMPAFRLSVKREIKPDRVLDDFGRKAMAAIRKLGHSS
jgi:ABC-type multidrug transport system ATPase subunit